MGTRIAPELLSNISADTRKQIEIHPFSQDLDVYYKEATALIDIDAIIENDVFLSSKITNYIMVNRIIISETGMNSPSLQLIKNIKSVIQCDHNANELFKAMLYAIDSQNSMQYDDRKIIAEKFKITNIVDNLNDSLYMLQEKRT